MINNEFNKLLLQWQMYVGSNAKYFTFEIYWYFRSSVRNSQLLLPARSCRVVPDPIRCPPCLLTRPPIKRHQSNTSRSRITWSLTRSFKASALRCFWLMTNLKPSWGECRNLSWVEGQVPALLMLYDSKLISGPVGGKYTMRWRLDGWIKNGSQRTNGRLISRSDKPEGLITNIPHFRVNYNMEMQWAEY